MANTNLPNAVVVSSVVIGCLLLTSSSFWLEHSRLTHKACHTQKAMGCSRLNNFIGSATMGIIASFLNFSSFRLWRLGMWRLWICVHIGIVFCCIGALVFSLGSDALQLTNVCDTGKFRAVFFVVVNSLDITYSILASCAIYGHEVLPSKR